MSRFNSRVWLKIARLGTTLPCPEMRLLGRWGEVLAEGAGDVRLDAAGDFDFTFSGKVEDREELARFLERRTQDPYDGLGRLRLVAIDSEGNELHCGYFVSDDMQLSEDGSLTCSGPAEGFILDAPACPVVGTEILLFVPERHWLSHVVALGFPPRDADGVSRHQMELLGSALEFEFDWASQSLSISVTGSDAFPQTYTEGWLSEPLRLMTGQLTFPRVIVRSNPGRAMVMVPPIRPFHGEADGYSLLDPVACFDDRQLFFDMYAELLAFIATRRDAKGDPVFDRHPLTTFYEELAQAMRGSRWIMTLTLASAVEGALGLLFPAGARDDTADLAELKDFKAHIDTWPGASSSTVDSIASLKDRAKGAVSRTAELTAIKRLRLLAAKKAVTVGEVESWEKVRNKVAHGKVFSPFSSADNDRIIIDLMNLFRRIAGQIALGRNPPSSRLVP